MARVSKGLPVAARERAASVTTTMRRRGDELATGEWAVLALVGEGDTHGFAVARALAPDGAVGRVWGMRRPLVYHTLDVLADLELVAPAGTEPSGSGPLRTLLTVTPAGRDRLATWLERPVDHVRDARSQLMLKLLFLDRAERDASELLAGQAQCFAAQAAELQARLEEAEGFARTLALWRLENTRAAIRFVEAIRSASH